MSMINKIIHGDCLEVMKKIPDGKIDMILCDLPYGVTSRNEWDKIIPIMPLWEQYTRIIKDSGAIILTSNEPFSSYVIQSNLSLFKYKWVWDKRNPVGFLNAKKQPLRVTEDILVFYKQQCTYNPQKEIRGKPRNKGNYNKEGGSTNYGKFHNVESFNNEYYPTNLLSISNAHKKGKIHPTQKPVPLFEYLICTYTNENDIVLDNCIGSGTTAIACINTKRRFIGIEKDRKYYDLAVKRISEHDNFAGSI